MVTTLLLNVPPNPNSWRTTAQTVTQRSSQGETESHPPFVHNQPSAPKQDYNGPDAEGVISALRPISVGLFKVIAGSSLLVALSHQGCLSGGQHQSLEVRRAWGPLMGRDFPLPHLSPAGLFINRLYCWIHWIDSFMY